MSGVPEGRRPMDVVVPLTVDQLREHVERLAAALGFGVVDIATDDDWTTFYVARAGIHGRVMVRNVTINSWSAVLDAKVGLGLGQVTRLGESSIFEVSP